VCVRKSKGPRSSCSHGWEGRGASQEVRSASNYLCQQLISPVIPVCLKSSETSFEESCEKLVFES